MISRTRTLERKRQSLQRAKMRLDGNTQRKYETLRGKEALLKMWEAQEARIGYNEVIHKHVLKLRAQIRNLKTQLRNMDVMNEL